MPSAFTHAAAALAISAWFIRPGVPRAVWVAGAAAAIGPDLDAVGFWAGVPYESALGHRGFSHSLVAAAIGSALLTAVFRSRPGLTLRFPALATFFFLAIASHGLLDAFTNGGLGVAFFAPFDNGRHFFPFTPIDVAPISVTGFFTARGAAVFASELLWVWLPAAAIAALGSAVRRGRRMRRAGGHEGRPYESLYLGARPVMLPDCTLPPGLRIAVAAPHPDDCDVIAVTLRHFRDRGDTITLGVLTSGSDPDQAAIREAEQRESFARFGLPESSVTFLRLPDGADGKLDTGEPNARAVREFLERADPHIVFLPHGNDSNVTHQRTHTLITDALATLGATVLVCLGEDPKTLGIRRDLLMPFDDAAAEWKGELLRCHRSQQARNLQERGAGLDARINDMNRKAARDAGNAAAFAEAFELRVFERGVIRPGGPLGATYRFGAPR